MSYETDGVIKSIENSGNIINLNDILSYSNLMDNFGLKETDAIYLGNFRQHPKIYKEIRTIIKSILFDVIPDLESNFYFISKQGIIKAIGDYACEDDLNSIGRSIFNGEDGLFKRFKKERGMHIDRIKNILPIGNCKFELSYLTLNSSICYSDKDNAVKKLNEILIDGSSKNNNSDFYDNNNVFNGTQYNERMIF